MDALTAEDYRYERREVLLKQRNRAKQEAYKKAVEELKHTHASALLIADEQANNVPEPNDD